MSGVVKYIVQLPCEVRKKDMKNESWSFVGEEREGKNGFGKGGGCRERLDNMFLLCSH